MTMSVYGLTKRQIKLAQRTREVASRHLSGIRGLTSKIADPLERFRATRPAYEGLIADGILVQSIPESVGGEATSLIDAAIIAEELQVVNPSVALTLLANVLGALPVILAGTKAQQERLLAPLLKKDGAPLASFCASEPHGSANMDSSDPEGGVRTTAKLQEGEWIIDGGKKWPSSATGWDGRGADLLTILCRTEPKQPAAQGLSILAVTGPGDGIIPEAALDLLGYRAHLTPQFRMKDLRTAEANLIGQRGSGLQLANMSFAGTSAMVGVLSVGLMRSAFVEALQFAKRERRGGSVPIIDYQAVGYALVDAKATIEACRAMSWTALRAFDANAPYAFEFGLQTKIFTSDAAVRTITNLMMVVGMESYDHQNPFASLLQDAFVLPLFDGGNVGVRRRHLHNLLKSESYDPLAISGLT